MKNEDPKKLYEQAFALLEQRKLTEAAEIAHFLRSRYPSVGAAHSLCGQLALAFGKFREAESDLRKGIELDPEHIPQYILLAESLAGQGGRRDEVLEVLAETMQKGAGDAQVLDACANVFTDIDVPDKAVDAFEKVAVLHPTDPTSHYNLATAYRFAGNLKAAEQAANKALELSEDDYLAATVRSDVHTPTSDKNYVDDLRRRLGKPGLEADAMFHFQFALAKELEGLGSYEEAFDALNEGAKIRRKGLPYSVDKDVATMREIARHYSREAIEQLSSRYDSDRPVFIIGLPRTGTTLLERNLQSHSKVASAGETNVFGSLVTQLAKQAAPKNDPVAASTKIDFNELGAAYVERIRRYGQGEPRLIDKLPFNFMYCGMIACALPNASFIHLTRHPMDTGFAIYKTLFAKAYPYSYDLEELGTYYVAYRKLMEHWHEVMPGRIMDVAYEDLVSDTEQVVRNVVTHCGLEFENDILNYRDSKSASLTASATQVRQAVYTSSVGKWRNVEKQLQPYADVIKSANYFLA